MSQRHPDNLLEKMTKKDLRPRACGEGPQVQTLAKRLVGVVGAWLHTGCIILQPHDAMMGGQMHTDSFPHVQPLVRGGS